MSGVGSVTSTPSTAIPPVVGETNPATAFNSVDLPQPDGPMSAANSPGLRIRFVVSRALVCWLRPVLKAIETLEISTFPGGLAPTAATVRPVRRSASDACGATSLSSAARALD